MTMIAGTHERRLLAMALGAIAVVLAWAGIVVSSAHAAAPQAASTSFAPADSFGHGTSFATGSNALATGDVDGVLGPDLVVASTSLDIVSVHRNRGDGTFGAPIRYPTFERPRAVALGRLDGGDTLDLVIGGQRNVLLRLGNGDGTFGELGGAGFSSEHVVVADVDADGFNDIVSADYLGQKIVILYGRGDGLFDFETVSTGSGGRNPKSVTVADLNGDGRLDLAVAEQPFSSSQFTPGSASVFLATGSGFTRRDLDVTLGAPREIEAADLDGDGTLDLAISNDLIDDGTVSIMFGDGDGTFGAPVLVPAGSRPRNIEIGDLNLDGILDIAVAGFSDRTVRVLEGRGEGTFAVPASFSVGPDAGGTLGLAMDDLNGDGKPDLAAASLSGDRSIAVLLNDTRDPALSIDDVSVPEGDTGQVDATLTVSMDQRSGREVSVDLETRDGTAARPQDYDARSGTLTFAPGETSKQVTVKVNGDTVAEDDETFTVELSNPMGATTTDANGTATIVDDDNRPPVAVDDEYSVVGGASLSVPAPGMLGDDTDAEDDPLTAVLVDAPAGGTVDLGQDGSLTYTPGEDTVGVDSFTYQAFDGRARSNVATVTITVVPGCEGRSATVVGTQGADRLRGTRDDDVMVGLGGDDEINGGGGNDLVCGSGGDDRLTGGEGEDRLSGGSGRDNLRGGDADDTLFGGDGDDDLAGGDGSDRLFGGEGADTFNGNDGPDHLDGGPDDDEVNGGDGDDTCTGERVRNCERNPA